MFLKKTCRRFCLTNIFLLTLLLNEIECRRPKTYDPLSQQCITLNEVRELRQIIDDLIFEDVEYQKNCKIMANPISWPQQQGWPFSPSMKLPRVPGHLLQPVPYSTGKSKVGRRSNNNPEEKTSFADSKKRSGKKDSDDDDDDGTSNRRTFGLIASMMGVPPVIVGGGGGVGGSFDSSVQRIAEVNAQHAIGEIQAAQDEVVRTAQKYQVEIELLRSELNIQKSRAEECKRETADLKFKVELSEMDRRRDRKYS